MNRVKHPLAFLGRRAAPACLLMLGLALAAPAVADTSASTPQSGTSASTTKASQAQGTSQGQPQPAASASSGSAASETAADSASQSQSGSKQTPTAQSAKATIEYLHKSLIQAMKQAKKLGYSGRYRMLKPVIEKTHDLNYIARTTLGSHWSKLSKQQQSTFVSTFSHLTIATYAGRFDGYSGEKFKFDSQHKMSSDQTLVRSHLVKSDGSTVKFDYVLRQENGHWKIINIVVDGVSDLAMKRAEYTDVIEKHGFQALISKLQSKIANYSGNKQ